MAKKRKSRFAIPGVRPHTVAHYLSLWGPTPAEKERKKEERLLGFTKERAKNAIRNRSY